MERGPKLLKTISAAVLPAVILCGLIYAIGLSGCSGSNGPSKGGTHGPPAGCTDSDNDGFYAEEGCGTRIDCNDMDPTVHPGAKERCVDIDMDCDGLINKDCTPEICGDGVDNDGDGVIDENCSAGSSFVPDTGLTRCYDDNEMIYPAPSPGEPFYGQDACFILKNSIYTKLDGSGNELPDDALSWTMVKDNLTGLIWEVKTIDGSVHDREIMAKWTDAANAYMTQINSERFGGYTDWRLPTMEELNSILNFVGCTPAINLNYFPNTMGGFYWTSTFAVRGIGVDFAWGLDFSDGSVLNQGITNGGYVRAVRGDTASPFYSDNGDGTVTATEKGKSLMWTRDSSPGSMTWDSALEYCKNLTVGGYTDWRLPNIKELRTLVDYDTIQPAINLSFFPDTTFYGYWSSTTHIRFPGEAWVVDFYGGGSQGINDKTYIYHQCYVRAVRGGL